MSMVLPQFDNAPSVPSLATTLWAVPAVRRGPLFQATLSFRPSPTLEGNFTVEFVRSAFESYWEHRFGGQVPVLQLRSALTPPVPIQTVLGFNKLGLAADAIELDQFIDELVHQIHNRISCHRRGLRALSPCNFADLSLLSFPTPPIDVMYHIIYCIYYTEL
jgi:hypothetical protein